MNVRVCAVVVTYNRVDLLRECLQALRNQLHPADEILVINNASTDQTSLMLKSEFPEIAVKNLESNLGSAGGFASGIQTAMSFGYEWLWLMDDDTIPESNALFELLNAASKTFALSKEIPMIFASKVLWIDRQLHPMNLQPIRLRPINSFLSAVEVGVVPIRTTSWVSMLLNSKAVMKYGLPYQDFFLWSDDAEYSARVLHSEIGYLVPTSVVVHKSTNKYAPYQASGSRYFYDVRNRIWLLKTNSFTIVEKMQMLYRLVRDSIRYILLNLKLSSFVTIAKGAWFGIAQRPQK